LAPRSRAVRAPFARLEAQIAIQTPLERMPSRRLGVAEDRLRWRAGLTLRGLETLPLNFGD
jgi:cytochrome P450